MATNNQNVDEIDRTHALLAHERNAKLGDQLNDAAIASANLAMKTAFLINGGAVIALLGFIASLVREPAMLPKLIYISSTLGFFGWGLALAAIGSGTIYFTHYCGAVSTLSHNSAWDHPYVFSTPTSTRWRRLAIFWQIASVGLGLSSWIFFCLGMCSVKKAIELISIVSPA